VVFKRLANCPPARVYVSKETYKLSKESNTLSKETYNTSKETNNMSHEAFQIALLLVFMCPKSHTLSKET